MLQFYDVWHRVDWYVRADVSEDIGTSFSGESRKMMHGPWIYSRQVAPKRLYPNRLESSYEL